MSAGERYDHMQLSSSDQELRVREDTLMDCIVGGLKEYQSRYEELLRAHDQLKVDHAQLQQTCNEEREGWKRFRQWWVAQQQDLKTKKSVSSPIPTPTSAPHFRTPGVRSSSGASSSKENTTTILCDVGLLPYKDVVSSDGPVETPTKHPRATIEDTIVRTRKGHMQKPSSSTSSDTLDATSDDKENQHSRTPLQPKTLNAEYEIDPAKNGDKPFLHKSVVRNKAKRKLMHAFDCECCKDWYDAVGPVAVRPFEDVRGTTDGSEDRTTEQQRKRQEHLQRTSRHRDHGPPPLTPPGYWDIGFPSTQRILELNRTADETDRRRKEMIARDPRFRRRSDISTKR